MRYSLHPESEHDLREAAEYYKERAGTALSQALFTEFEHSIQLLLQHPLLGALWPYGKRRLVMKHFPYSVIYTVGGEEIQENGVRHDINRKIIVSDLILSLTTSVAARSTSPAASSSSPPPKPT